MSGLPQNTGKLENTGNTGNTGKWPIFSQNTGKPELWVIKQRQKHWKHWKMTFNDLEFLSII